MAYGYFFVCFIVNLSLVAGQSVRYALKGGEAILSTTISKPPDDILWKHNGDKVITFDSSVEKVFREYKGRFTLAWDTAELTISDVRYEDSGKYELEALIEDKRHYFQIMLKVLDEVAKPTITCEINDESSNKTSGRRATLLCSSESQTPESLTFQWNVDGEVHMGQRLPIALGKEHNELKYFCTAENPLQRETAVFITKDCNTERKLENRTVSLPIIIIIIVVLVLIVLCIFLFILYKYKLKMVCFKKGKKGGNMDLEQPEHDEQNESQKLLLDRQETFASKQKLPQQLPSENGNVRNTSQKEGAVQKTKKIFDQGGQTGKVQKIKRFFDQGGQMKVLPDTQTGEPNNTHNNVETGGQPDAQNKVHVENPDPDFETDEHKSKDQMVEQETGPKEEEEPLQNNSSPEKLNPDGELDNSSKEQSDQPEQQGKSKRFFDQGGQMKVLPDTQTAKLQPPPSPQSRPPHVDQDSESGPSEAKSKGQSDSEEKSHTDPMVDKELQTQHSEHEKAKASTLTGDSVTSTYQSDLEKAETSDLANSSQTKEPTDLESSRASGQPDQNPDSGLGELDSKDQRVVDGKSHTDKESQRDHSDSEKAEESALTGDLETSTNEKKAAKDDKSFLADDSEPSQTEEPTDLESSKASGQPGEPNNTHNNVETEGQPVAQNKVHVENPDPNFETDEHKSKNQMVKQETGPKEEEEPLQNNSSPEKISRSSKSQRKRQMNKRKQSLSLPHLHQPSL